MRKLLCIELGSLKVPSYNDAIDADAADDNDINDADAIDINDADATDINDDDVAMMLML